MTLWTILDSSPEGRGANWYPTLDAALAPLFIIDGKHLW